MKFCLLNMERYHPERGVVYTIEQNHINTWAKIMNGVVYNVPLLEQGGYGLDYDYFNDFDLIMLFLRQETIELGIKIKNSSKAKMVIFLDREVDYFTTHINRDLQARMVELLNIVDAVAVLHDESIPLFRALTSRPVSLVGLPYPVEKVQEMCPPVQKRQEIELGSTIRSIFTHNQNALVNLGALAEVGIPGVVNILNPKEKEFIKSVREHVPLPPIRFRYINIEGKEHYITQANYSILGLHLDCRYTWGRFTIDCAAVRMPCVAPSSFYTQKVLFPRLCVPFHDIEGAVALMKKLISDPEFYEDIVAYAQSQIELFSYEQCKTRLLNII